MFLLAAYGKKEKANLSKAERNAMAELIPILVEEYPSRSEESTKQKKTANKMANVPVAAGKRRTLKKHPIERRRIIEGLEQAVAWTRGDNQRARVTLVHVPDVDVREVRQKMGLSQGQFATKFGLPPATLRNWEQGRSRPDAPHTRAACSDCQAP